jgi:hypothetical protein
VLQSESEVRLGYTAQSCLKDQNKIKNNQPTNNPPFPPKKKKLPGLDLQNLTNLFQPLCLGINSGKKCL